MDISQLIGLADVKEAQAFAMTSIYNGKVSNEELQKAVDDYCNQMATSFLAQHSKALSDDSLKFQLRRYILSIGADKKHSGHRFYEALYNKLNTLENNKKQDAPQGEREL